MFTRLIKRLPFFRAWSVRLDNQWEREEFVKLALSRLAPSSKILDAGCGSQRYKKYCGNLAYRAQDFGQYKSDAKKMLGSEGVGGKDGYRYGQLDYIGDIWEIDEADQTFDAILCTEVFEHIPYPIETLKEFSRLLKSGGVLILTAPSNCLRHMDPFFFYTGFSDRWYEKFLKDAGFEIKEITSVGDYYSWLMVEMWRTASTHSVIAKLAVMPAFLYFSSKKKTRESVDTLCMGYHIVAAKI